MGLRDLFKKKESKEMNLDELTSLPDIEEMGATNLEDGWGMSQPMKGRSDDIDNLLNDNTDERDEEDLNPPSFDNFEEELNPPSLLDLEDDLNPPSFEKYEESVKAKETRKALGGREDGEVSPPPLLPKRDEKDDLFKSLGDLEEDLDER